MTYIKIIFRLFIPTKALRTVECKTETSDPNYNAQTLGVGCEEQTVRMFNASLPLAVGGGQTWMKHRTLAP